jgi:hypothetical protein
MNVRRSAAVFALPIVAWMGLAAPREAHAQATVIIKAQLGKLFRDDCKLPTKIAELITEQSAPTSDDTYRYQRHWLSPANLFRTPKRTYSADAPSLIRIPLDTAWAPPKQDIGGAAGVYTCSGSFEAAMKLNLTVPFADIRAAFNASRNSHTAFRYVMGTIASPLLARWSPTAADTSRHQATTWLRAKRDAALLLWDAWAQHILQDGDQLVASVSGVYYLRTKFDSINGSGSGAASSSADWWLLSYDAKAKTGSSLTGERTEDSGALYTASQFVRWAPAPTPAMLAAAFTAADVTLDQSSDKEAVQGIPFRHVVTIADLPERGCRSDTWEATDLPVGWSSGPSNATWDEKSYRCSVTTMLTLPGSVFPARGNVGFRNVPVKYSLTYRNKIPSTPLNIAIAGQLSAVSELSLATDIKDAGNGTGSLEIQIYDNNNLADPQAQLGRGLSLSSCAAATLLVRQDSSQPPQARRVVATFVLTRKDLALPSPAPAPSTPPSKCAVTITAQVKLAGSNAGYVTRTDIVELSLPPLPPPPAPQAPPSTTAQPSPPPTSPPNAPTTGGPATGAPASGAGSAPP